MQQQGTSACKMRDALVKARYQKKITLKEITDKLIAQDIPDWLQAEIIQMTNYNKLKRLTCPVELAMEAAVNYKILDEIIKETNGN